MEMANLLEVGVEFESFDAFQASMEQYEDTHFVQFSRIDSRSVEKAQETTLSKTYSPHIKFSQLTYACTFGPRKGQSKSAGIRNSISRKIDCPVRMRISATPDGQRLVIKESKLDCHNHDISEELYKSLSRQKQLDEETELEIYNLISTHEDKRLARMLVRDKLTKETGRSMSIKDILNIEKKVSRKLEMDKSSDGDKTNDNDTKSNEDATNSQDEEAQQKKVETEPHDDKAEAESHDDNAESHDETIESHDEEIEEPKHKVLKQYLVKQTPRLSTRSKQSSSTGRPQRNRREPHRFRDANEDGIPILHTSKDSAVSFVSHDEANTTELNASPSSSLKKVSAKVKEESTIKTKKRKLSNTAEHPNAEINHDRKLAIKEELLEMEKKKILLLQEIVKKLDIIIENQERR